MNDIVTKTRNHQLEIKRISIISAMAINRVIGNNNRIPWHIPGEQKRFRQITWGHPIIMGRRTYESIGKALPGRASIVITRQKKYIAPGCMVVNSLEQALKNCPQNETQVFVIGGEQIFRLALPVTNRIYLTTIQQEIEGDIIFPEFSLKEFKKIKTEFFDAAKPYTFSIYERVNGVNPSGF